MIKMVLSLYNYIKNEFEDEFSKKKKSTKVLFVLIILFLSKMIRDIYNGYSKSLKLTNIIVSIPLTSLFIELIFPAFLFLFFIVLILKQIEEETAPDDYLLYLFKTSCCLQIYFYIIYIILIHLLSIETNIIFTIINRLICLLIIIIFFSLYFRNNRLIKKFNENGKLPKIIYICFLYLAYSLCIYLLFFDLFFSFQTSLMILVLSFVSYCNLFSIESIKFIINLDFKELKKYFFPFDGPFYCMCVVICVLVVGILFSYFNFENVGRSIVTVKSTYTEIASGIEFEFHKDANGYLLFKTIDHRYIAIAYKKENAKNHDSNKQNDEYITILEGYKYVDLNNLEIANHDYIVEVDK